MFVNNTYCLILIHHKDTNYKPDFQLYFKKKGPSGNSGRSNQNQKYEPTPVKTQAFLERSHDDIPSGMLRSK